MADPVWEAGNKEKLTAICERDRAEANDVKGDLSAFSKLHSALSRNGPLNVESLLQVAQKNNIAATRDEIAAIFAKYDADKNSNLELKEFAAWWSTATDGLSVLLRNALSEALLQPGQVEQWKRGNSLRVDITAGKVDDSFEAKSGIYLTVVPSSNKNLCELAGVAETARAPQGILCAKLSVKSSATDEEVGQLIDLVNVVADEMTQAQPDRAPFRVTLGKTYENGKRLITVKATVLNAPKDPSKMVNHIATLAGLKDQALFRRVMVGLEFGTAGSRIFAPMPDGSLAELFENFRMTANFEYDDALLKMLTVLSLQPDGLNDDSLINLILVTFLARGARSVHAAANFRSYKEVIAALINNIARIPLTSRPAKDSEELYKQAMASAVLRMRLEAATSLSHVRATIFNAIPTLEMVYGETPTPLIVQVFGIEGAGKSRLLEKLGVQPNGPYFAKRRIHFDKKPGKQHLMVVESDGPFLAQDDAHVVCVLDASSEERLAMSLRHVSVRITNSDSVSPDKILIIVSKAGGAGVPFAEVKKTLQAILEEEEDAVISQRVVEFDGNTCPEALRKLVDENLEDAEDSADAAAASGDGDDDDGEDEGMAGVAKKVFKGASKVVAGVEDIEVTNSLVSVHVLVDGLPVGDVVAETDPERIKRNRMEFGFRFQSIMDFAEGITDISELAESWAPEESDS